MNPFIHTIDPVIFRFGALSLNFYNLSYLISFAIGFWGVQKNLVKKDIQMSVEHYTDFIFHIMLGTLLGGRLGYVFIYRFAEFLSDPLTLIRVWEGGMSFHGGAIGVILATIYFCRKSGYNFYAVSDPAMPLVAIGVGLVRVANFLNGELYGSATNLPWAVVFARTDPQMLPRHPSQLYEALCEGFLMAIFLQFMLLKTKVKGLIFWLFIGIYGVVRFFVEFIRIRDNIDLYEEGHLLHESMLSMGQILSLVMICVAVTFIYRLYTKGQKT